MCPQIKSQVTNLLAMKCSNIYSNLKLEIWNSGLSQKYINFNYSYLLHKTNSTIW